MSRVILPVCALLNDGGSIVPIELSGDGIPEASGVYQIHSRRDGRIYIGSAVNLRSRWIGHRRALRNRTHHNPHLQAAWDLYGEANFQFMVMETAERRDLLKTEQSRIDRTRCTEPSFGFNISRLACSAGEALSKTWEGFRDPNGVRQTITNLYDFCRRNGLDFPSMHRLAKGRSKLKSYKGWTHENSVRKRAYIKSWNGFIDPDGRPIGQITNLAAFCRERGLDPTHMVAVSRGRIISHRGWTHLDGKKPLRWQLHEGFVSPAGNSVSITNLNAFCKKHGLCAVHMFEVKSGKRRHHKGWTWRDSDDDPTHESRRHAEIHQSAEHPDQPVSAEARS